MAEDFWNIGDIDLGDLNFADDEKNLVVSTRSVPTRCVKYENAVKLAKKMDFSKNNRYEAIVRGDFIFGDFIEAFFVENNIYTECLTISTLSFGAENIASLHNLIEGDYVGRLRILASCYFYANERKKGGMIEHLYGLIDNTRLECVFADVHTKAVTFKTEGGKHIVINGSANLRSSGCTECFSVEDNEDIFDMYESYYDDIFKLYKGEPLRHNIMNKQLKN